MARQTRAPGSAPEQAGRRPPPARLGRHWRARQQGPPAQHRTGRQVAAGHNNCKLQSDAHAAVVWDSLVRSQGLFPSSVLCWPDEHLNAPVPPWRPMERPVPLLLPLMTPPQPPAGPAAPAPAPLHARSTHDALQVWWTESRALYTCCADMLDQRASDIVRQVLIALGMTSIGLRSNLQCCPCGCWLQQQGAALLLVTCVLQVVRMRLAGLKRWPCWRLSKLPVDPQRPGCLQVAVSAAGARGIGRAQPWAAALVGPPP